MHQSIASRLVNNSNT